MSDVSEFLSQPRKTLKEKREKKDWLSSLMLKGALIGILAL